MSSSKSNANQVIFFTGFPGFIGFNLIRKILLTNKQAQFRLLIEPKLRTVSETEVIRLNTEFKGVASQIELIEGDITASGLGMTAATRLRLEEEVSTVYHLAAIYDLAVPYETAHRINVDGTQNILYFCLQMKKLDRLIYFSTCYVAGDRQGKILESELGQGQKFKNHYESTKHYAEQLVQAHWDKIPTVIIRPAIVVGHSQTGETRKYDGPYFMVQLLLGLPRWLPLVHIGPGQVTLNVVPVDYIINATEALANAPHACGKVYALADPNPLKVRDLWLHLIRLTDRKKPFITLPVGLVKTILSVGWIRQFLKMPRELIDYCETDLTFDTQNAVSTLTPLGVSCPRLTDYLPLLVEWVKRHPRIEQIRKQIY